MKVTIIPTVIGALCTVTKGLLQRLEDLKIRGQVETIETTAFFKIGLNTEKNPGDLRNFAVTKTLVRNHQLKRVK